MRALEVDRAEDDLEDAKKALQNPDLEIHPEATMLKDRYLELVARLDVVREEKARRELELAIEEQRQNLERGRTRLLHATDALSQPQIGTREINEVRSAAEALSRVIEEGKKYEAKSTSYADDAAHAQRRVEGAKERIVLAELRLRFIEGPAQSWVRGRSSFADARKEKKVDRRQEKLLAAQRELQECSDGARKLLAENGELATASIVVEGKPTTAAGVSTGCGKLLTAVEKAVAKNARAVKKQAAKKKGKNKKK